MIPRNYIQHSIRPIIDNIVNGVEISVFPTTEPMLYKINIGYFNTLYFSTRNGHFFSIVNNLYEVIPFILGEVLDELIRTLKKKNRIFRNCVSKYQRIKMENKNTEVSKDTINGMDYSFNVLWADAGGYVIDETCDDELCRAVITKTGLILISVTTGEAVLV